MTPSQRTHSAPRPLIHEQDTDPTQAALSPSAETPRTSRWRLWAQRQAHVLRRYYGAVVAFAGVLGLGAAEIARGGAGVWFWLQAQGPWAMLALLGLALWIVHIVHGGIVQERERDAQREERVAWQQALRDERRALEARQERMIAILEGQAERQAATFQDAIAHLVTGQGEHGRRIDGLAAEVQSLAQRIGEPRRASLGLVRSPGGEGRGDG